MQVSGTSEQIAEKIALRLCNDESKRDLYYDRRMNCYFIIKPGTFVYRSSHLRVHFKGKRRFELINNYNYSTTKADIIEDLEFHLEELKAG